MRVRLGSVTVWFMPELLLASGLAGLLALMFGQSGSVAVGAGIGAFLLAEVISLAAFFLGRRLGYHSRTLKEALTDPPHEARSPGSRV